VKPRASPSQRAKPGRKLRPELISKPEAKVGAGTAPKSETGPAGHEIRMGVSLYVLRAVEKVRGRLAALSAIPGRPSIRGGYPPARRGRRDDQPAAHRRDTHGH
jgi:hypothetical protein